MTQDDREGFETGAGAPSSTSDDSVVDDDREGFETGAGAPSSTSDDSVVDDDREGSETGAGAPSSTSDDDGSGDELTLAMMALSERTADLQRLQAEYLNYKRRVDRDRDLIRENATYAVLVPITEVLDTIDRARAHGPLEDGFRVVADQLDRIVTGLGLTKFGSVGDAFDPMIHEALSHIGEDPEVEVTTCKVVAKAGYRIGERVVRAAQVLVVDPAGPVAETPSVAEAETGED